MSVAVQNLITSSRSHLFHSIKVNPNRSRTHITASSLHYEEVQSIRVVQKCSPNRKYISLEASPRGIPAFESGKCLKTQSFLLIYMLSNENRTENRSSDGGTNGRFLMEWKLDSFNLDAFLSVAEVLCFAPLVVFSIGCALNWAFLGSQKSFQVSLANSVFVWQFVLFVGAVGIGALIRRRQWRRIYMDSSSNSGNDTRFNLVERVQKLEEDIQSSETTIRALLRQLEKLGIRFRVTRRNLREPFVETAALAQKNSEATRALAVQEEILEKELGEIQKVLMAMQEQQQKQLELILAIGKCGKLKDNQRASIMEERAIEMQNQVPKKERVNQMEIQTKRHGSQQ